MENITDKDQYKSAVVSTQHLSLSEKDLHYYQINDNFGEGWMMNMINLSYNLFVCKEFFIQVRFLCKEFQISKLF